MKPRLIWVAACTTLLCFVLAQPVLAHGDLRSARPEVGSTVPRMPRHISIDFTEGPTGRPEIGIVDGCRRPVAARVTRAEEGQVRVAVDRTAQPGKFTVSYRIVSAVDGHPSEGSYKFTVAGKRDCSPVEPGKETSNGTGGDGDGQAAEPAPTDSSGTTWLLAIGGGTLLLVAVALVLRRSGGRDFSA